MSVATDGFPGCIAAGVRELMVEAGVTLADMAAAIGISREALSERLTYQTDFSVSELGLVAAALDMSAGDVAVRARGMLPA